jgi:hypothetical protein
MPNVKLLKLSTQSLNSIAKTLHDALAKELKEEEEGRVADDGEMDKFGTEEEEELMSASQPFSEETPGEDNRTRIQCKNVLKHRRRMMRGHKHKKRLKRDRYKSEKK